MGQPIFNHWINSINKNMETKDDINYWDLIGNVWKSYHTLRSSSRLHLDPLYDKWLGGIVKMWGWYDEIDELIPQLIWTMPESTGFHPTIDILKWTSHDVKEYIGDIIEKGTWSEMDKPILNGLRKFYLLNKGKGKNWESFITTITHL
jgi:hypothetical protein